MGEYFESKNVYPHHAGLLQMTELEGSLRKLKMIPGRYGTTCKAAVKALHQLGFNDE